jgi:hypothetical protein
MLTGIGLIGTLTATIASFFVQEKSDATDERLERIEALLAQLVSNSGGETVFDAAVVTSITNQGD